MRAAIAFDKPGAAVCARRLDGFDRLISPNLLEAELRAAFARARALGAEVLDEPHANPNAGHRECWLRDPDGHVVVLAGAEGAV